MSFDANAIIAEATVMPATAQPQVDAKPEVAPVTTEVKPEEAELPKEQEQKEEVELTPEEKAKKLENALARNRKALNRARREAEQLRKDAQAFQVERAQPKPEAKPAASNDDDWTPAPNDYGIPVPKLEDFSSAMKFMDAVTDYKLEVREAAKTAKQQDSNVTAEYEKIRAERNPIAAQEYQELSKSNPEVIEDLAEYKDVLDRLHPSLELMLLQADKPLSAAHYLANEGVLDDLPSMPLEAAQFVFKRTLARMQTSTPTPPPKPQTKAQAPLPSFRGSVAGGKPEAEMSVDQLMKKYVYKS